MSLNDFLHKLEVQFIDDCLGKNMCTKILLRKTKETTTEVIVIPDCRFYAEYKLIKESYGNNVKVVEIKDDVKEMIEESKENRFNLSDIGIPYDYIIENNSLKDNFDLTISEILEWMEN